MWSPGIGKPVVKGARPGQMQVSVAETYNNMGNVYQAQGDYEKALFHYQNALDIKIKSLGGAHASDAAAGPG